MVLHILIPQGSEVPRVPSLGAPRMRKNPGAIEGSLLVATLEVVGCNPRRRISPPTPGMSTIIFKYNITHPHTENCQWGVKNKILRQELEHIIRAEV